MDNYEYCERSLDAGDNDEGVHNVCWDEYTKRIRNGFCITCGATPKEAEFRIRCVNCDVYTKYENYAGPQ